jgi:hypothetical protein
MVWQDLSFTLDTRLSWIAIHANRILDLARWDKADRPGRASDQSRFAMNELMTAGQAAGSLIAILTLGGMLVKWGIVRPIKSYIDQMTRPIQPNANGGRSLPDVIEKVNEIKDLLNKHIRDHDDTRKG